MPHNKPQGSRLYVGSQLSETHVPECCQGENLEDAVDFQIITEPILEVPASNKNDNGTYNSLFTTSVQERNEKSKVANSMDAYSCSQASSPESFGDSCLKKGNTGLSNSLNQKGSTNDSSVVNLPSMDSRCFPVLKAPETGVSMKIMVLWDILDKKPTRFSTWELLIKESESLHGKESKKEDFDTEHNLRKVYTEFLSKYPLCYRYWKKLADFEFVSQGTDKAIEVCVLLPHQAYKL
ncbi:hypothetical protein DSO57_1000749 [Entomophthora muscae]|uniref:Uncharacterized protein n=1 Tax=Entomophthora muscae TaxID=34485 RepID=A0ACC2T937_9FUNG|nr:hypothetical protein DSO57_1000749 [Entomophthora muscae]